MEALVRRVWQVCRLAGYAGVDLRVDRSGEPWVPEVNANPCLTPGMGIAATAEHAGMSFNDLIGRITAATLGVPPTATPPVSASSSARPSRPRTAYPRLRTTLLAGDPSGSPVSAQRRRSLPRRRSQ